MYLYVYTGGISLHSWLRIFIHVRYTHIRTYMSYSWHLSCIVDIKNLWNLFWAFWFFLMLSGCLWLSLALPLMLFGSLWFFLFLFSLSLSLSLFFFLSLSLWFSGSLYSYLWLSSLALCGSLRLSLALSAPLGL